MEERSHDALRNIFVEIPAVNMVPFENRNQAVPGPSGVAYSSSNLQSSKKKPNNKSKKTATRPRTNRSAAKNASEVYDFISFAWIIYFGN